jgi:hypothetical protein
MFGKGATISKMAVPFYFWRLSRLTGPGKENTP